MSNLNVFDQGFAKFITICNVLENDLNNTRTCCVHLMHSCAYTVVGILPHAIKQVSVVGLHVGSGYPWENSHYWLGTVPHYSLIF